MVWFGLYAEEAEKSGGSWAGAAMLRVLAFTHLSSVTEGVEELVHVTVS